MPVPLAAFAAAGFLWLWLAAAHAAMPNMAAASKTTTTTMMMTTMKAEVKANDTPLTSRIRTTTTPIGAKNLAVVDQGGRGDQDGINDYDDDEQLVNVPGGGSADGAAGGAEDEEATYLSQLSDEEYIDFVANFLKPTAIEWVFVTVFLILMAVGICGNCLVVYVVSRNKHMWTSMNLFLTNLAMSDLLVLVFCLPPTVLNDITKTFWLSEGFCKAMLFVQNTSVYVSVLTLVAISLERWKAISKPLSRAMPSRRTCQVICLIWLLSAAISLPEPFTLRTFPAEYARKSLDTKWGTRCKESWSPEFQQKYQLIQTVALFIAPLFLISALCLHMNIVLRQKAALQIGSRHLRERQRAMRMLCIVVLVFAISYMPVHLHNIATAFHLDHWGDEEEEPSLVFIALRKFVPRVMSYSSSVINPITYNFMSEKFRKEFRRACCLGGSEALKKELLAQRESLYRRASSGVGCRSPMLNTTTMLTPTAAAGCSSTSTATTATSGQLGRRHLVLMNNHRRDTARPTSSSSACSPQSSPRHSHQKQTMAANNRATVGRTMNLVPATTTTTTVAPML